MAKTLSIYSITDQDVAELPILAKRYSRYPGNGFAVTVAPNGRKYFSYYWKDPDTNKYTNQVLGTWPMMKVLEAIAMRNDIENKVKLGVFNRRTKAESLEARASTFKERWAAIFDVYSSMSRF